MQPPATFWKLPSLERPVLSACTTRSLTQGGDGETRLADTPGAQGPCLSGRGKQAARWGWGWGVSGEKTGAAGLSGHAVLPGPAGKAPANRKGTVSSCVCPRWWQEGGMRLWQ